MDIFQNWRPNSQYLYIQLVYNTCIHGFRSAFGIGLQVREASSLLWNIVKWMCTWSKHLTWVKMSCMWHMWGKTCTLVHTWYSLWDLTQLEGVYKCKLKRNCKIICLVLQNRYKHSASLLMSTMFWKKMLLGKCVDL